MGEDERMPRCPRLLVAAGAVASLLVACGNDDEAGPPAVLTATSLTSADTGAQLLGVEVLQTVPHRIDAWTEGLVWEQGALYESVGLEGRSSLSEVDPATGDMTRSVPVDAALYAEGLAQVDDELIQLTWQDGVALRYDAASFDETGRFSYDGEGWGLCFDGERLVMSDGSPTLTFRDPTTFEPTGSVDVDLEGDAVDELNELECVGDRVYANVWHTDMIVEIDPGSGEATAVIDASDLRRQLDPMPTSGEDVLNGIAYDPEAETFWLTGKFWPQMFEVRFVPTDGATDDGGSR
jgi:glutaminyl-peptide cyclotransferase